MLSETYHSISDTGNQVFLLIGIRDSKRGETQSHPFGHGKSQFFYSFLVSVMLFGIAGWESAKHGYDALMHPGHGGGGEALVLLGFEIEPPAWLDPLWVNYTVLIGAFVFETYALIKARAEMKRQIDRNNWSGYREAFRKTSDVTTLTALTEDTIALAGSSRAGRHGLTELTGNELFDAGAALLIGILLMGFAIALAWENKRLLIGESVPVDEEQALRDIVKNDPRVVHIDHFRASYVGPNEVIVFADLQFDPALDAKPSMTRYDS